MAPPLPTLTTAQFTTVIGSKGLSELEECPLKRLSQFDCVMKRDLPISGSNGNSKMRNGDGKLVCTEFYRYFRRCQDVGRGANVEVTALMGIRREAGENAVEK